MSDRVSDLIFRDVETAPSGDRTVADREATLREELDKLRIHESGPRVIPASRTAEGERGRSR
jgi:hypothetical protein